MRRDDSLIGQPEGLGLGPDGGGGGKGGGKVLILGAGWMGSRVAAALGELGEEVEVTHRPRTDIDAKDPYFRPVDLPASVPCHAFDLLAPESWDNLPPPEELSSVVITFPLALPHAARFWHAYLHKVPTVLCYSSTSVYQVAVPGQCVDEQTPLRASPRAQAEQYLQRRGAQVLTLSGIFSEAAEARSICACLHGYLSSARAPHSLCKTINLVHDADIVRATLACLRRPHHFERFNVAGTHLALRELLDHCAAQGVRLHDAGRDEPLFVEGGSDTSSKTVLSERLVAEVMPAGFAFRPIASPAPQIEIGQIAGEIAGEIEGAPEIEARHEARAALLSDVLPLSPADWLSEANSLAGR